MKIAILNVLTKKEHQLVKGYQIAKGNIIYHEGDVCENIGIVISGKIDIVSYSFEGKEQLINTLKAGEIFGNNLLFSSEPLYRGDVVAKEKSVVAFINKENLVFLLQNNAEFLNLYLNFQDNHLITQNKVNYMFEKFHFLFLNFRILFSLKKLIHLF